METPLRGCSGGHTGTAPTVRLGGLRVAVDTVWVDYVWDGWFRLGGLRVGGFVCWENGAHEPTPSVLYFCQPRVD